MTLVEARRALERTKGQREQAEEVLSEIQARVGSLRRLRRNLEQAQALLQAVARQTQAELEYHVSEMVSLALATVFGEDAYEFGVRFVERRGRTECDLVFLRGGAEVSPLAAAGGGAVDVAAFALRVALWRLRRPRSRSLLVLDEPFRFLSRELQPRASALLKEVSRRLGVQILMVSHSPDLIEEADRVFRVEIRSGVSRIEVLYDRS